MRVIEISYTDFAYLEAAILPKTISYDEEGRILIGDMAFERKIKLKETKAEVVG